jgi:uncharacterized protein (TIGR02452 family)
MSSNRQKRSKIGLETNEILNRKEYVYEQQTSNNNNNNNNKQKICIACELDSSCAGTMVLDMTTTKNWLREAQHDKKTMKSSTYPDVTVLNTTTFAAAREIFEEQKSTNTSSTTSLCCLNFASAKRPGGGFLKGSQAQEESLARASGLYSCLLQAPTYYKANRKNNRCGFYEDLIIYSPSVPVFRNDNDELIEDPWKTAIITAPAPNRGAIRNQKGLSQDEKDEEMEILIEKSFKGRIDMILSTAIKFGHRHIILGAWGCGVFQNDPFVVANLFKNALLQKCFEGKFDTIVFAVLDLSKDCMTFNAFEEVFTSFPN